MNIKQITVAIVGGVLMCGAAHATTWYVAANGGSDGNDGKTEATAFATIHKAYGSAASGDVVIVDDGVYAGFGDGYRGRYSDSKNPLKIKSRNGWRNTVVVGAAVMGWNSQYDYVILSGVTISNSNCAAEGGILNQCRITHCVTASEGRLLSCAAVNNSVIDNCSGYDFSLGGTFNNVTMYNNSFRWHCSGKMRNCTLQKNSGDVSYASFNNCIQCESSWTTASTDPLLRDPANGDFRLQSGSPCIDAGNNSYASGDCDLAGNPRIYNGTVDIGAYEWKPPVPAGIENVIARQRYPWNGLVDLLFTVTGEPGEQYDVSFAATNVVGGTNLTMNALLDEKGAALTSNAVKPGTYRWAWNAAADLPDGFKCDRVTVTATAEEHLGGVQLWEGGPYWAECNVGATKPEEYGYYFWWGDTVGYKRNAANDGWVSVKDGTEFLFTEENCPTYGKNNSQLESLGYIDSTGSLVATHDAATAHLGWPWRMPSDAEMSALISNCTTMWVVTNGVCGQLVTGKGAYESRRIFLPAAGYGNGSSLYLGYDISYGDYWSATQNLDDLSRSWYLGFTSSIVYRGVYLIRCDGQSVRPVRDSAK